MIIPSAQWADDAGVTPIAVGDARELVTLFSRLTGEMTSTAVGGTAWRNDNVEIKYILREVARPVDTGAVSLLQVTLPS